MIRLPVIREFKHAIPNMLLLHELVAIQRSYSTIRPVDHSTIQEKPFVSRYYLQIHTHIERNKNIYIYIFINVDKYNILHNTLALIFY